MSSVASWDWRIAADQVLYPLQDNFTRAADALAKFQETVSAMVAGGQDDCQPAQDENAQAASGTEPDLGTRILVVEDNPVNQKITAALLASQGFFFDIAENGQIAVDKMQERDYGLVLMDIQMPYMDGFEATRQIRAMTCPRAQVPIVAVTANAMRGDKESYLEAGMNDFVPKPVDVRGLISIVNLFLGDKIKAEKDRPAESGEEKPPISKKGAA